jgi:hypothetical protein
MMVMAMMNALWSSRRRPGCTHRATSRGLTKSARRGEVLTLLAVCVLWQRVLTEGEKLSISGAPTIRGQVSNGSREAFAWVHANITPLRFF